MKMNKIDLERMPHQPVGIAELDRVLGGGLVEGGVVLVGGEPGVGKSTLLLQACQLVAAQGRPVLYVSGEESARQVRLRAKRLNAESENLYMLAETDIESICGAIEKMGAPLVVIDSIQTMRSDRSTGTMGSVSQVRACAGEALRTAKETGATVLMVGHVTREGNIAGPRVLEHMVDTVLYFEGERKSSFRVLRAVKNRFGSTDEIGVFEMTGFGMQGVLNPSQMLIGQREQAVAGAAVTCSMEGTRPVLCEVQALCAASPYGQPRRMATGVDFNRMLMLLAVMERAGVRLYNADVYANAVGGLRLSEPASDLAIVAAIASAAAGKALPWGTAFVGEVGLTGEVRPVSMLERRANECAKLGFDTLYVPKGTLGSRHTGSGMKYIPVENVSEMLAKVLGKQANNGPARFDREDQKE